jgi:hypothetical protein
VIELSQLNSRSQDPSITANSSGSVPAQGNIGVNDLNAVSIDAINSMLSMCSMVYMMCIQKLGGEE